jgi:AcrR family transcriptional regulator
MTASGVILNGTILGKRVRLSAEVRRDQLIQAASRLLLKQGYLPLPLERLASEAGVSKALIYGFFPDQHDLFNAVLARQFEALADAGLEAASQAETLEDAALACADIYLRHVAQHGPIAHIILRDLYMARRLRPDLAAFRNRIASRLARLTRTELRLPPEEAVGAINLVTTIPEETGRLIWQADLDLEQGLELGARLVRSSLAALRPT